MYFFLKLWCVAFYCRRDTSTIRDSQTYWNRGHTQYILLSLRAFGKTSLRRLTIKHFYVHMKFIIQFDIKSSFMRAAE